MFELIIVRLIYLLGMENSLIVNLYLGMSVDQRILEKIGLAGSSWIVQFGSKSCRRK